MASRAAWERRQPNHEHAAPPSRAQTRATRQLHSGQLTSELASRQDNGSAAAAETLRRCRVHTNSFGLVIHYRGCAPTTRQRHMLKKSLCDVPGIWRRLSGPTMTPFPHPARRTGHADLTHPALGQDLTPSPTARRGQARLSVRARSARRGARVDRSRPCVA